MVAIGIVVVLVFVARKVDSEVQLVLIGIVMGGALGNIIDRLIRVGEVNPFTGETAVGFMSGAVVDFIDVQWWPVFNVADAAVVCGGIALAVLQRLRGRRADERPSRRGARATEPAPMTRHRTTRRIRRPTSPTRRGS